jgi:hypothetical protein
MEGTPFARREIETIVNKTGKAVRLTTYGERRKALPVSGKAYSISRAERIGALGMTAF